MPGEGSAHLRAPPGHLPGTAGSAATASLSSLRVPSRTATPARLPEPPEGPFPPSPGSRSGVRARAPTAGAALPERAGDGLGERGARASLSPCGTVLPSQRRRPRQPGPLSGFPGRETPLAPKHHERLSPPLPCRAARPPPLPRAARPRRREGHGEEGKAGSPRCGPAPPLPRFPGAASRQRREQGRERRRPWSPTSCAFPRP